MLTVPSEVSLLLSGACNLACAYCYLDRKRPRATMRWDTLAAALDAALGSGATRLGVEFTGGEPLLEIALLERAVDFIERRRPAGTRVEFSLTTNGTLLTRALLSSLFARGFAIRLSFDGISAVQDLRGPGTFAGLDRLLDRLRTEFPDELRNRVTVAVTLVAAAIPRLAASVRYLVDKGATKITLGPRLTWDPDWRASSREELKRQVDEILDVAVDHWRHTGVVPVGFLARPPLRERDAPVEDLLCGASTGMAFCVSPDGHALACSLFAASLTTLPPLASQASRAVDLGLVTDEGVVKRLTALADKAGALGIFTHRLVKHSSYGACAECRFVADCQLCPASICHIPGNRDPDLVPDFICAFNYVTLAARERFDEITDGEVSAAWYREMKVALAKLEVALQGSAASAKRARSRGAVRNHRRPTQRTC